MFCYQKNSSCPDKKIGIHASAGNSLGDTLLSRYIKSYLISHAHLDHIIGMVMCSTIDSHKEILGRDSTIDYLRDYIFNWENMAQFSG